MFAVTGIILLPSPGTEIAVSSPMLHLNEKWKVVKRLKLLYVGMGSVYFETELYQKYSELPSC